MISDTGSGVLMDFGSVGPARIEITDRKMALAVTEECAQKCTGGERPLFHSGEWLPHLSLFFLPLAPYRAPELHDVPSGCVLTEKVDVWSFGCTLYAMLFGNSPFDGSATSAMSGLVRLPTSPAGSRKVPPQLEDLIKATLQVDPEKRPSIQEVEERILALGLQ